MQTQENSSNSSDIAGRLQAFADRAALLYSQGQLEDALQAAQQGLALDADNSLLCNLAGICAAAVGRYTEAEDYYRRMIRVQPQSVEAYANLALLLEQCERFDAAETCHLHAIALDPGRAQIHSNFANLLARQGRLDEAEQLYRQAIALDSGAAVVHSNFGVLMADRGREDEAEQSLRQALTINPDYPLARLNLAQLLLSQGRLAEGWLHHEARYDPRLPSVDAGIPALPFPQWNGEPLAGKSILICPEQGLGDAIQFCRYLPMLKAQGATRITLVCRPALKALLATLDGVDSVIDTDEPVTAIELHDYWTFPLSLPLHCKTTLDNIPASIPYLRAAPDRMQRWVTRIPKEGLRVGLVWKGNPKHANDAQRSLPHLSTLSPILQLGDVSFVSLQKGSGEDETKHYAERIVHLGAEVEDFADVAAIVQQLDLVICVDTAVAHVAGALGKPCWVLLPAYKTDWRWLRERTDSPWYPNATRLFRQRRKGDWTPVIDEIKHALYKTLEDVKGS